MRPGRELDATVAQQIFEHRVFVKKRILYEETPKGDRPLRNYSKDIEAAWEVVEKLKITLLPIENGQWFAMVGQPEGWRSPADFLQYLQTGDFVNAGAAVTDSAALSICLAATKAIEARKAIPTGAADTSSNNTLN